jgi:hypothetical protein
MFGVNYIERIVTQIKTDKCPSLDWRVRRRTNCGSIFLIRRNESYEIDRSHDLFWRGAIRGLSFREITDELKAGEGIEAPDAIALACGIYANFLEVGLILMDDPNPE